MTIEILIIALSILSVALLIQGMRYQKLEEKVYELSLDLTTQKAFTKSLDKQITTLVMRADKPPEVPREIIIKDFKPTIKFRRIDLDKKPSPAKEQPIENIPQPPDLALSDIYDVPHKKKSER